MHYIYLNLNSTNLFVEILCVFQLNVCYAAHSVLASITTARRFLCTRTLYPYDFAASAAISSTLVTTVSLQSKNVPAMLANFRLMFMASVISAPSVMAVKS